MAIKTAEKETKSYKDNDYSLDAINWRQQQYENRYNETLNAVNKRESDYLDSLKNNNKPVTGGSQGVKFVNGRKITVDNTENINNNYMRTNDGIVRKQSTAPQQKSYSEMSVEELNAELSKAKAQTEQAKKDYNYELSRSAFPLVGLFTEEAKAKKQMQKEAESKENEIKNALFKANQKSTFDSLSDESKEALAVYYDSVSKDTPLTVTPQYAKQQVLDAFKKQGIATDDDTFASIYEYYKFDADEKRAQRKQAETEKKYNNASTLGKVGMNAKTVATSPIRGLSALTQMIEAGTRGYRDENAPLNINDDSFDLLNYSDTVRGNTQKDIASATNNNIVADALYSAAMSAGDMASNALLSGGMGSAVTSSMLGVNAATSSAKEATQRGISKDKAITTGITSGLIETATEKIPLDNLYGIIKTGGTGAKAALKSVLKQAGIEATEEAISEIANTLADGIINGADSQYEQSVKAYMNAGVTEEEAKKYATNDVVKNIGKSALAGGISGGVLGGGAQVLSYGMNGRYNSLNPLEDSSNNNQVNTNADTQKGSMTDGGVQARAVTSETESDSTSFDNNIPTLQNNVNESVNVKEKTAFQDHVDNVNKLDSNKKPMTDIEIEQTKADLFKVTNDIKRDLRNTTNMYYKGENRKEIVSAIEKMIDDYAENPTDENFEIIVNAIGLVDGAMHGQKYTRKKSGVTTVYDNELSVLFNHNADSFVDNAYKLNGRNIADNVAGNPTLTAEFKPQQTTQNELNPLESNSEVKNSRYSTESVPNKSDLPDEVTQIFVDNPTTYNVLKNADTKAEADSILQSSDNLYKTVSEYKRLLDSKNPTAIPLGYELSKKLIDSGDVDTAVDIIRDMSTSLTKSGQFTQSAAMTLLHENPQAAMRYAIKEIDSLNSAGAKKFGDKWKDISLTDDEINAFSQIDNGDTEAIKGLYESIGNRIAKEYPATKWEKFVELTKIGMLLNPRTHIRNTVSNAMLLPIRSLSDRVSAVGMNVAHILNPDIKVTQSLTGSIGGKYKKAAESVWENVKEGIIGSDNKWDDLSGSVFKKQVFKDSKVGTIGKNATVSAVEAIGNTKIVNHLAGDKLSNLAKQLDSSLTGSFTENIRNFDYYLLSDVEDNPFVKQNFVNRLASYMKAQGITDATNVPDEAISLATSEALKATFKDDNMLTNLLSGVKKSTGKLGEVMLPFTKTPANLAMRGIDYSPAGLVSTANKIRNKADFSEVMDSFSKNLVGTSAIAVGYILANSGIIRGALSDDKDEAEFQKQQGEQAYSFNINGTSYTFDWAQPASIPLIIGATIHDSIAEDDANNDSQLSKVLNYSLQGAKAAANSWVELSPLQTFAEMFGGNGYGKNDIAGNIMGAVAEMPLRLIPSLGSAVANTGDTSQRVTYNNGDAVGTLVNQAKAKIPYLRETLPQAYDTWGNPKVNAESTGKAAFNNFISPGKSAVDASTPIDDEIQRLYDATGNNAVFPRKAEWSVKIGEESKKLTGEEYSAYQKGMGELSYELAEGFINSASYKSMEDANRAEVLDKLYSFSKALYEQDTFGKPMSDSNAKIADMYESGGTDAVIEYMDYKNVLGKNNMSDTDKMRTIWNEKGKEGIETWNELREMSKDEDGNIDTELLYSNLANSDMSEEDKGYYLLNNISRTDKIDSIVNDLGNAGVYRYYEYKRSADKNGNGSLTVKDELVPFLNSQPMSNGERAYWFDLMKSSKKTKNPYGQSQIPYLH